MVLLAASTPEMHVARRLGLADEQITPRHSTPAHLGTILVELSLSILSPRCGT